MSGSNTGGVPVGTVVAYALNEANIPSGWLICNGLTIPSQYQELISLLGSSTTPDLSGRTLIGSGTGTDTNNASKDFSMSSTGGEYDNTLTVEQIPSHQHFGWGVDANNGIGSNWSTGNSDGKSYKGSGKSDTNNYLWGSTYSGGQYADENQLSVNNDSVTSISPGTTEAHNNVQPYYVINYIIFAG